MVRMPWSEIRISRRKLRKANQMMGLMSTPNAGGTNTRVAWWLGWIEGRKVCFGGGQMSGAIEALPFICFISAAFKRWVYRSGQPAT